MANKLELELELVSKEQASIYSRTCEKANRILVLVPKTSINNY